MGRNDKESNVVVRGNFGRKRPEQGQHSGRGSEADVPSDDNQTAPRSSHPIRRRVAAWSLVLGIAAPTGIFGVPWALEKIASRSDTECIPTGQVMPRTPEPLKDLERIRFKEALQSPTGTSSIDTGCTLANFDSKGIGPVVLFTQE